jgi:hypothetical protein
MAQSRTFLAKHASIWSQGMCSACVPPAAVGGAKSALSFKLVVDR